MDGTFKFKSPVSRAAVIECKHHISLLGHVIEKVSCATEPAFGNQLGMRTSVNIDKDRVFFCRIKGSGFDHPAPEVCAVIRFHRKEAGFTKEVIFQRIGGSKQVFYFSSFKVACIDPGRRFQVAVAADEKSAVGPDVDVVRSLLPGEQGGFPGGKFQVIKPVFKRTGGR